MFESYAGAIRLRLPRKTNIQWVLLFPKRYIKYYNCFLSMHAYTMLCQGNGESVCDIFFGLRS